MKLNGAVLRRLLHDYARASQVLKAEFAELRSVAGRVYFVSAVSGSTAGESVVRLTF